MLHSFIDVEILHSTIGEELSRVPSSTFSIGPVAKLNSIGINIAIDDVFFNLLTKDT